jgi:hypothetical protein
MEEKKEKQRKILPPLEELIGGSTSDLVSEALKKVIAYPPDKKEPKSEPRSTLSPTETKSQEPVQKQDKKIRTKTSTRLQYTLVPSDPAITEPSYNRPEIQEYPATIHLSKTYLITPHFLLDEVLPTLNAYEQVLLVRLYRLSYGFRRKLTDHVGKKTLADKCNMSIAMVKKVLRSLESRGLIEKIPDRSNDPTKGNKYRVLTRLLDNPVLAEPSNNRTQYRHSPIIVLDKNDDNSKTKDHHLRKAREIYETITNNKWTKKDDDSYQKVKKYGLEMIERTIKIATKRAKSPPSNFEYFVREIHKLANPAEEERKTLKRALGDLANFVRQTRVGGSSDLSLKEDIEMRCEKEGTFFDDELYEEIIEESRHGHWEPK